MSVQAADEGLSADAFDALEVGRLTWIGLALAGIGWTVLLGEATVADILARPSRPVSPTFHADLVDVANCIIASGFAIALIGALQSGFGTLNRFFTAVLVRSARNSSIRDEPPSTQGAPSPARQARPYRLLPDGSVEVETILGTRRFATMTEARDFI